MSAVPVRISNENIATLQTFNQRAIDLHRRRANLGPVPAGGFDDEVTFRNPETWLEPNRRLPRAGKYVFPAWRRLVFERKVARNESCPRVRVDPGVVKGSTSRHHDRALVSAAVTHECAEAVGCKRWLAGRLAKSPPDNSHCQSFLISLTDVLVGSAGASAPFACEPAYLDAEQCSNVLALRRIDRYGRMGMHHRPEAFKIGSAMVRETTSRIAVRQTCDAILRDDERAGQQETDDHPSQRSTARSW